MRTDLQNWEPLTITEVSNLLESIPVSWGIAGGWALDMHLGRKTREHADTDIVIFREDQQAVFQALRNEWQFYKAKDGELAIWQDGEFLESVNDIWASRDGQAPWSFQLMLMESEQDQWVYRREKSIQLPKASLFSVEANNIPYLKPAIQLLHKAGSSHIRDKDVRDFQRVLPVLSSAEKAWLKDALQQQFPTGHSWIQKF